MTLSDPYPYLSPHFDKLWDIFPTFEVGEGRQFKFGTHVDHMASAKDYGW